MLKKYPVAILEVLVLQRFPYGKDSTFFYFATGKNLKVQVGDVVRIPWRKTEIEGVVVSSEREITDIEPGKSWKHNNLNLKPIASILEKRYFSADRLKKLKLAAKKYFVSWNHFAKSVVDLPPVRAKKGIKPAQFYLPLIKEFQAIASKDNVRDKSMLPGKVESFVFASYGQKACIKAALKTMLAEGKQALAVVPEKTNLIPVGGKYAAYTASFSRATPVLLGKFLPRVFARGGWELARQKTPNIFVGTRSAIFAPFANLGLIIVEDGQDSSHKQWDLAPLYDIRKLLDLFYPQALKIYLSDTPRLEDFYDSPFYFYSRQEGQTEVKKLSPAGFEKGKNKNGTVPGEEKSPHLLIRTIKTEKSKKKVVLINTRIEKSLAHEEAVLSAYLKKQLVAALKKQKSALLVINHSGVANEKIKEALQSLKTEADFALLEAPTAEAGYTGIMNFNKKLAQPGPIVLLGYGGIIPLGRAIEDKLGLAAILDFDETLFYPDFRSEERTASRFYNLLSVAPKIYIQTSDPNQPFLRKIVSQPYSALFQEWFEERRKFLFPPAVNIMRIDVPRGNLVDKIINDLQKNKEILEVLNVPVSRVARANKYQAAIVLKYKRETNIFPIIDNLFRRFGNLRIDPDPEEL